MSLGQNVKNIRREKGFSIMKLKELTGLSKSTISDLENDKSSPTAETLQKIANALGASIEDFFRGQTFKMPKLLQRKMLIAYKDFGYSVEKIVEMTSLSEKEIIEALTIVPITNYENLLLVGAAMKFEKEFIDACIKEDSETLNKYENLDEINNWLKDEFYKNNNSEILSNPNEMAAPTLPTIPEEFDTPEEARAYVKMHKIFGSEGFDANKMNDEDILDFANELLQQMKLVSYKYKR